MKDLYEQLAYDYDEFGAIEDYLDDEKVFLDHIFSRYQVSHVLDCACGTGQHLLMLAKSGYRVTGSDFSAAMLRVAKENLWRCGYEPDLRQCDFRYLEQVFDETFDGVICLTNSLPHLRDDGDLVTALKSMKGRIRKGGVLVLSSGTTHATLALPPIEVVVNRIDFSRIFVKEHDERFQTIHVVDLFHGKDRMENHQYDIVYRLLLDGDYRDLLSRAGYGKVSIYGDYAQRPYVRSSMKLIVVAEV